MKNILPSLFAVLAFPISLSAQEASYPHVQKFAADIKGIIWDLRGTNSLRHLRFDGENVEWLKPDGKLGGKCEYAFVDAGVFRLNFKGANAGWYFVSDDARLITPTTVSFEFPLKTATGTVAKKIKNFPDDIQGVAWEGERDGKEMKLRWDGSALEVAVKDSVWKRERQSVTVVNRRVFEAVGKANEVVWFVFSEDGTEGWVLQIQDVFGGHARGVAPKASLGVGETQLPLPLNDLANHAEDLVRSGETMRAGTLKRALARKLSTSAAGGGDSAILERLSKRLGPLR